MKYTEEQVRTVTKKLLKDIKRPYFEHMPFNVEFINDEDVYGTNKIIENAWKSVVFVQEDQFPDKEEYAIIIITLNDDTGDIESYIDTSCGRPVPMKAKLNDKGKYELLVI